MTRTACRSDCCRFFGLDRNSFGEPLGEDCFRVVEQNDLIMSASTLTEALIVCIARERDRELVGLIEAAEIDVQPHTAQLAYQSGEAFRRWAKAAMPRLSITAIAAPMRWQNPETARFSTSATTSAKPTSSAPSPNHPMVKQR